MANDEKILRRRNPVASLVSTPKSAPNSLPSQDRLISIPLSDLVPDPFQARHDFSNLEELKESIKKHSQIEPIIVIQRSDGKYIIKNGERRFRAIKLLAEESNQELSEVTINAICKSGEVDDFLGSITTMIREGYSPFEIALLLRKIKDKKNGITDEGIGEYIGRSRNIVTEYLSLLKLPQEIQDRELTKSLVPFNKLKQLAVGAKESNREEKIAQYKKLVTKYSEEEGQDNEGELAIENTFHTKKPITPLYTKKFIAISNKIDSTIKSIEKFGLKSKTTNEEKQAMVGKLDEIIAKAQAKKNIIASELQNSNVDASTLGTNMKS